MGSAFLVEGRAVAIGEPHWPGPPSLQTGLSTITAIKPCTISVAPTTFRFPTHLEGHSKLFGTA